MKKVNKLIPIVCASTLMLMAAGPAAAVPTSIGSGGDSCPHTVIECPVLFAPSIECYVALDFVEQGSCEVGNDGQPSRITIHSSTVVGPISAPVDQLLIISGATVGLVAEVCCPPLPKDPINYPCGRHRSTFDNEYDYTGFSGVQHTDNPGENNIIRGSHGDDYIDGADGNDCIFGMDGDDILHGNSGSDILFGGAGNDRLYGGAGSDQVDGGPGNDIVAGNFYADHPGHPSCGIPGLGTTTGANSVRGGDGHDTVVGCDGRDYLDGGAGNDQLIGFGGNDMIRGRDGDDTLWGGHDGNEDLYPGEIGHNDLYGDAGNDVLYGSFGNDRLVGGVGEDSLSGRAGADYLSGGVGDDDLHGGAGDDYLSGGPDYDYLHGGSGTDQGHGNADEGHCVEVEVAFDC